MSRLSWTQPACDECWWERYPGREPARIVATLREKETCVYCGKDTRSGIYVRIDPAEAPHPTLEKD